MSFCAAHGGDAGPTDIIQVLRAMTTHCDPATKIDFLRNTWSTKLDPSQSDPEDRPHGSKALIDACKLHRDIKDLPRASKIRRETYEKVAARWQELGFEGNPPELRSRDHWAQGAPDLPFDCQRTPARARYSCCPLLA